MDRPVAFITGAGNGINRGIALVLAAEGYSIAVFDTNDEGAAETIEMIEKNGGTGIACHVDVADRATVDAGVAAGIAAFGRVDALVSGAGYPQDKPFLEMTEQDWDRMIAVHMKGAFNTTQATVPHMRDRGFGRIVCISSTAANNGSWNHAHYAAATAGILGFVRAVSKDVGQWGITVNAVLPGRVDVGRAKVLDPAKLARVNNTAVGRVGKPDDIAYAVRYLVSQDAGYVTGIELPVHGGI